MLRNGAKIHKNEQEVVNVNPRTLEDYMFKECMKASGDDVDDEDFSIKIKFDLFAKPEIDPGRRMEDVKSKAQVRFYNTQKINLPYCPRHGQLSWRNNSKRKKIVSHRRASRVKLIQKDLNISPMLISTNLC